MDLDEFYGETPKQQIQVIENQLIIAKQIQDELIEFEKQRKAIEVAEKNMKQKLESVMRENNITSYESSDNRIRISLGDDTVTETIDKDKLFMEYPDAYRNCLKETPRKGTLRITIRGDENGI